MSILKDNILRLREQGLSYRKIEKTLGCSRSTVSYYCGNRQKEKNKERQRINRNLQHPYKRKIEYFSNPRLHLNNKKPCHKWKKLIQLKIETFFYDRANNMAYRKPEFTVQDVIDKFGEKPKCYLTGKKINIYEPRTYEFDHKIPVSRGGDNSIENLGICTKKANQCKRDMTPTEFIEFCKQVVDFNKDK